MQLLFPKPQINAQMINGHMVVAQPQVRNMPMESQLYTAKYAPGITYIPPMLSHRMNFPVQPRPRRRRANHSLVATMDPVAVARRNERERNRVKLVNEGFDELRKKVPFLPDRKKLSKVEILRCAMLYIGDLKGIIEDYDNNQPFRTKRCSSESSSGSTGDQDLYSAVEQQTYIISDEGDDSDMQSDTSDMDIHNKIDVAWSLDDCPASLA